MELLQEVFIPLQGYSKDEISQYGNIRNVLTYNILKPRLQQGYLAVNLYNNEGIQKINYIHRLIAIHYIPNPDNKQFIDHANGVRTDNRPANLRWSTVSENNRNKTKKENLTSRYKGVNYRKDCKKWRAEITKDSKKHHLGYFKNEKHAAAAYNNAAIDMFSEYAKLNEISDDE